MQSSLIRSARTPLAYLTLCAIIAPASTARAQSPAADHPLASVAESDSESIGAEKTSTDEQPDVKSAPSASIISTSSMLPTFFSAALAEPPAGGDGSVSERASPAPAPAEPAPAALAPAGADDGSGLRTAGFIAGGVGLAGMALFAIAGLGAKSAYDKLDADCGTTPCTDDAHRSDIEGGRMLQTAANIGLAAGLTGLGVGATLLVLGSRSSVEKRGPAASVSTNGAMITYGGRF